MKLASIAGMVSGKVVGDPHLEITGARDLAGASEGDLSFVQSGRHLDAAKASKASAFLVPEGLRIPGKSCVEVFNPKVAFIEILSRFLPSPPVPSGVHPKAVVDDGARLSAGVYVGPGAVVEAGAVLCPSCRVGPGAFVGAGCRLGEKAVLHANVTLYPGTVVGDRAVIHSGAVMGADGFGYVQEGKHGEVDAGKAIERYMQVEGPHRKVPQLGNVIIGEDVEIGASVTVDRGTLGSTVIGRGTKIDNQVQIGHNVQVGEDTIIIAEVGIGGSVRIGRHVTIGGNCGIAEGADIGDFCIVGAHTLVYPGKKFPPRAVIFGNPAREASKTRDQMLAISGLPRTVRKLRNLEERIAALEKLKSRKSKV